MTQIYNGKHDSCVEDILSHRISTDKVKYEYHVKMNHIESTIWVSESYLSSINPNLLELYKKKAGLTELSDSDGESYSMIDFAKFIALNFNECMDIKLEVGIEYDESTITNESPAQVLSSVAKIKTENIEYGDLEKEIDDGHNKVICDKILKDNLNDKCSVKNLQDETSSLKQVSGEDKRNGYNSEKEFNNDPIDRIFSKLPIVSKITNDTRDIIESSFCPINFDILRHIIERGNIDLLHNYMYSDQRESLTDLIISRPSLFVLAAKNNDLSIVSSLLSLGIDINGTDSNLKTALMYACENENENLIDLLVNNGAALHNGKPSYDNILFFCCENNKPKAVRTLLNLGADFARVKSDPQLSLREHSKDMKLIEIHKITEKYISQLSCNIKTVISSQLGPKIQIDSQVMPIYVLSPIEIENEIQITFDANINILKKNSFNLLFILTGLILGSKMQCFFSDCFQIKSVVLNGIDQQSFSQGFKAITSFNLMKEKNKLSIYFENNKCRKTRIILAAYSLIN